MELFLHPGCVPFTVALGFLLFLCLYQIGSLVLGLGLPGAVEAPDLPDLPENGLSVCLDWLNLGRVPIIVALILFSWVFAALGLVVQNMLNGALGFMLPVWIAVPAAGAVSLVLMHWLIPPIAAILPKDETSAIDEDYVGRTAVITIGVATAERPAEARARDRFGRDRYLQVIPDLSGESLSAGEEVLIVAKRGRLHTAIRKDG
ncbi:MAG: DUF1449 family protein [Opitutales bacterium]|nr:DUF1449 family protein [Opitutales bacterium]